MKKQDTRLAAELARRKARGLTPTTLGGMRAALAAIGYKLDRRMDCRSDNRYVTGEFAGESYQAINGHPVEADTGLSFANNDARRDWRFKRLQEIRYNEELFAVVRGRLYEI